MLKPDDMRQPFSVFESEELKEAERFFQWALSYERKGLKIAADAMRDEGRKAFTQFLLNGGKLKNSVAKA